MTEQNKMKFSISAIVLTFNEERNIDDCLKSILPVADEIFVVDSYSSDATLARARRYTANIFQHPFEHYAKQRNWAQTSLPLAHEWVLHVDADERLSSELIDRLTELKNQEPSVAGFMMARRTVFRGRWIKHGDLYPVYHLRLFKKQKGRCEERLYDQHFIVDGPTAILAGDMITIQPSDLAVWRKAHRRWATLEAREIVFSGAEAVSFGAYAAAIERRKRLRYLLYYRMPIFIRAVFYYLYRYFIRLGFLDGFQGALYHWWHGFWYRFLVDSMILRYRMIKRHP